MSRKVTVLHVAWDYTLKQRVQLRMRLVWVVCLEHIRAAQASSWLGYYSWKIDSTNWPAAKCRCKLLCNVQTMWCWILFFCLGVEVQKRVYTLSYWNILITSSGNQWLNLLGLQGWNILLKHCTGFIWQMHTLSGWHILSNDGIQFIWKLHTMPTRNILQCYRCFSARDLQKLQVCCHCRWKQE